MNTDERKRPFSFMKQCARPCTALAVALMVAGATHAATPEELATASGCLNCHDIQVKKVGPAFKSVAEKYRGQPDIVNTLTQTVRNGGRGNWGRIPMPPHQSVAESDIKQIVTWVLTH